MKEEVQISIVIENKPGTLAKVIKKITDNGIKLDVITGEAAGDRGVIRMITDDPNKTISILDQENYKYAKDRVISKKIKNTDELRFAIEKLGNANINIKSIYLHCVCEEESNYIFVCDDLDKAKKVLESG